MAIPLPLVHGLPARDLLRTMKRGAGRPDGAEPPAARVAPDDWSLWYLTDEEDVSQAPEHWWIAHELCSLLVELARERGWQSVFISGDQFVAWVEEHPLVRMSPDVYLTDNPPAEIPASWQTWLPGHRPPRFAVEIVSDETWKKDYDLAPEKYSSMGVSELVIADPYSFMRNLHGRRSHPQRVPIQVHRRLGQDIRLTCVAAGMEPVHCAELDAYLVFRENPHGLPRVRISRDPKGRDLLPTPVERAEMVSTERDEIRVERDVVKAERDEIKVERDEIKVERDVVKAERDEIKAERDEIKVERDEIKAERDAADARARDAEARVRDAEAQIRAAQELLRKHGIV